MTKSIEIEYELKAGEDDDDIQEYKRPWVGLTDEERQMVINKHEGVAWETAIAIEQTLKEKNV